MIVLITTKWGWIGPNDSASPVVVVAGVVWAEMWNTYQVLIVVANWRFTRKYKGSSWWAGLAKFTAVLPAVCMIFGLFKLFVL